MRLSNTVVLASLNRDKLEEFQALFGPHSEIEIVPAQDFLRNAEKLALVENYSTYLENAAAKARLANQGCHYPCLADDSGLEVDALNGAPGVRSHRYAKVPGASKIEQDRANIELILSELQKNPSAPRSARFVCSLALVIEGVLIHASGTLEGTLAPMPRGTHGFGYDPIFIPSGSQKTLAEMTAQEKNAISHRAKAVQALLKEIEVRGMVLAKP